MTQSHLDVLTAPDSTRVALAGQAPAPGASGRADWSRARGLALSLENLPPLQPGRTYQVWLLTAGMPVSAGLLTPDAAGRSTGVYSGAARRRGADGNRADRGTGGRAAPTHRAADSGRVAGARRLSGARPAG